MKKYNSLVVGVNEKSVLVTNLKLATRLADTHYTMYNIKIDLNNFSIQSTMDTQFGDKHDSISLDWDNLINGIDQEKSVLILYKNPVDKFLSGIIEDTLNPIIQISRYQHHFESTGAVESNLILNSFIYNILIKNNFKKNSILSFLTKLSEEKLTDSKMFKDMLFVIIDNFLNYFAISDPITIHTEPHLPIVSSIYTRIIDTNNVTLIDIGEEKNLEQIFSNYSNIKVSHSSDKFFSNSSLVDIAKECIAESSFVREYISTRLRDEIIIYNKIKKIIH